MFAAEVPCTLISGRGFSSQGWTSVLRGARLGRSGDEGTLVQCSWAVASPPGMFIQGRGGGGIRFLFRMGLLAAIWGNEADL